MRVFSIDEVIGEFEAMYIEEEKIKSEQLKVKGMKKALDDRQKDFAKNLETKKSEIKKAYDYWKSLEESGGDADGAGDAYEIMAMLDANAQIEKNEEGK